MANASERMAAGQLSALETQVERLQGEVERNASRSNEQSRALEAANERLRELEAAAAVAESAQRQNARLLKEREEQLVHLQVKLEEANEEVK